MKRPRQLLALSLTVVVLLAGGVAVAHAAAADSACKGGNWVGNETGPDLANGRLVVAMDTCEAAALAAKLRGEADNLQTCVNLTGLAGTIVSFFLGAGRAVIYGGAIAGFTLAGSCNQVQTELRGWANKITEWNARCADHGIKFRMGVAEGKIIMIKDFVCQKDSLPDKDKSTGPTPEDLDYPDGQDGMTLALVPAPQPDGGPACGTDPAAPAYSHDAAGTFVRDTFTGTAGAALTYQRSQWNPQTGAYDMDLGAVTRCGPPPLQISLAGACAADCDDPHYDTLGPETLNVDLTAGTYDLRNAWSQQETGAVSVSGSGPLTVTLLGSGGHQDTVLTVALDPATRRATTVTYVHVHRDGTHVRRTADVTTTTVG